MKINLRWQLLLAVMCIALLVSLLSYQVQSVGLCTTSVPASGGQLVEGIVGQPQFLNPLLSQHNPVDQHLSDLIFDGLVRYGPDGSPQPALAREWEISDDGRTFTFNLREDARWHDGQPVVAQDVAFTYGLLQDESFPAPESLRVLWQAVVITPTTESQISFTLPQPFGPFIEATTTGILPEHILGDVPPADIAGQAFSSAPVGSGPFLVPAGSNWRASGRLTLAPNPLYWRNGVLLGGLQFRFYSDVEALYAAFETGEIQAISMVPDGGIALVGAAAGMRLFSSAAPQYSQLLFNMTDEGFQALQDKTVRQALAMGTNRPALIDRALDGQGVLLDGPYLPQSWAYSPGKVKAYDGQTTQAIGQLEGQGWTLPEGAVVRQHEGQELALRLLIVDQPRFRSIAAALAEQWSELGVGLQLTAVSSDEFLAALQERAFDVAIVDVEPGYDPDLYDFWSQEAIIRGQNYGGWNNRRASEALENARRLTSEGERRPYYEAFLSYFDSDVPALTLYQHVYTYGLSEDVKQAEIGRIDSPRELYKTFDQWFTNYRDVASACPDAAGAG
jgi:peptide/nickel transport system substrate-binding protein